MQTVTAYWQPVLDALEVIRAAHGGTLPLEAIVQAATDENSPLHRYFEWDGKKAAQAYRIEQARWLVNRVKIFIERGDEQAPVKVHAYVSLVDDRGNGNGNGYRATCEVLSDEEQRNRLLKQAAAELLAWRERYHNFLAAADALATTDQLILEMQKAIPA